MPPDPGQDPTVWLAAAREHLATTESGASSLRIRCFHGQRTVELAFKAVLLHHGIEFPYTHTLAKLVNLMPDTVPAQVSEAAGLTPYAIQEMYPDTFTELGDDHAEEAVELARAVVTWAASIIEPEA